MEQINKADAALYVDVTCYICSKSLALSNTIQLGGHYLCSPCETEFAEAMQRPTINQPRLLCIGCNKPPDQIQEYIDIAGDEGMTPDEYVSQEEGTFNRRNGHFLCTKCYVKAGCPSTGRGWVAP